MLIYSHHIRAELQAKLIWSCIVLRIIIPVNCGGPKSVIDSLGRESNRSLTILNLRKTVERELCSRTKINTGTTGSHEVFNERF